MNNLTLICISALLFSVLANGCGSTEDFRLISEDEKSILMDTVQPSGKQYQDVTVFVTSVEKRTLADGGSVLLVKGQLPNGCARLREVSHHMDSEKSDANTVTIQMAAWKKSGEVCTQQMVPFTYLIEDISVKEIKKIEQYRYKDEIQPLI